MTVYTSVEFHCPTCQANILYEDELPIVNKDKAAVTRNNRAVTFLKQHPLKYTEQQFQELEHLRAAPLNSNVTFHLNQVSPPHYYYVANLESEKYILCILCNSRIYITNPHANKG